jgi:serine/threonine protein kinase/tetratricopeptide (TPR) repeat protein
VKSSPIEALAGRALESGHDTVIGKTLSHYRILAEVSRGGMGIVYRALDTRLDREVALKVLPPELLADPERRRRFEQEARAASKLEHPNIAVIHEIDESDGIAFLTMELIRGEKLADRLLEGRLPWPRALEIATEIAEGLARAHDRGVVHRDLKPANVMITEDGHPKIIDFGLAKLVEPLAGGGSESAATRSARDTERGVVLGTVLYMSPEQARAARVDHRTDVFSFGVLLFEMLSGRRPFDGASQLDILQAIVSAPTPRLEPPPDRSLDTGELQRILDKCLAKEPGDRYQSMKDLVVDLRAARRRLESGTVAAAPVATPPRRSWLAALGVVGVAAVAAALLLRRESEAPPPLPAAGKPSLAVLRFDNLSGDPSLDWLQTGLADMLITDLSQSTHLDVLSTDRLYQVLRDMRRLDERIDSLEVVQDLAQRGGVKTVLEGSFLKAGESIRINVRIQEAATGRILTSEKVEGIGEASLFDMVDDLSRRVRLKLDVDPGAVGELDRDLRDVTTASVDAYREYAEGINLQERGSYREAVPRFEAALKLDPGFAMALAKLSIVHSNLGHDREWVENADRALEHLERLTPRERYYIEGNYYMRQERTADRAIEAYRKAVELYPDHASARNNLALLLTEFEHYQEAVLHYQFLVDRGVRFVAAQSNLAGVYSEIGEDEKALAILQDAVKTYPDSGALLFNLGQTLNQLGRPAEALEVFERARSLDPAEPQPRMGLVFAHLIRNEPAAAEPIARELRAVDDPFFRFIGSNFLSFCLLQQGRSAEGLAAAEEAARAAGGSGRFSARAYINGAHILLERGEPEEALRQANEARIAGEGNYGEWAGLFFASLAEERLGKRSEADRFAEELRTNADALPTEKEKRRYHHLRGELLLSRGDARGAIEELEEAAATLPARGLPGPRNVAQHVPIWFSLASAYRAAGQDDLAEKWYGRIVSSTTERMFWPIPYVRSFYYLAKIHEERGDTAKAKEYFRRFFDFWKDGDLDRGLVEEARLALRS